MSNVNNLIANLVEVALTKPVDEFEDAFKLVLSKYVPFCYSCGKLTMGQSVCFECAAKSLKGVPDER